MPHNLLNVSWRFRDYSFALLDIRLWCMPGRLGFSIEHCQARSTLLSGHLYQLITVLSKHYMTNILSALSKIQTAKALKSVKVKRTQVMQGKKQKIHMILNENKKTGKVVEYVTSVGRLFYKRLPATWILSVAISKLVFSNLHSTSLSDKHLINDFGAIWMCLLAYCAVQVESKSRCRWATSTYSNCDVSTCVICAVRCQLQNGMLFVVLLVCYDSVMV